MSLDFWPDFDGAEEASGTEVGEGGELVADDARPVVDPHENDYRDES